MNASVMFVNRVIIATGLLTSLSFADDVKPTSQSKSERIAIEDRLRPFGVAVHQRNEPGVKIVFTPGRSLTDAAIADVRRLGIVHEMSCEGNSVSSEDFARVLGTVPELESLALSSTERMPIDLTPVRALQRLKSLWLRGASINTDALRACLPLPSLETLDLDNTSNLNDDSLQVIGQNVGLRFLFLDNTQIGNAGLSHLQSLKHLQALRLDRTKVTDEGIPTLRHLSELRILTMRGTSVSGSTLFELAPLTKLESLQLHGARLEENAVRFPYIGFLKDLSVSDTRLTDRNAAEIAKSFPKLERLDISNSVVSDHCIDSLMTLPNLTEISAVATRMTSVGGCRFTASGKPDAHKKVTISGDVCLNGISELEVFRKAMRGEKGYYIRSPGKELERRLRAEGKVDGK
jgi:hypothetical protein